MREMTAGSGNRSFLSIPSFEGDTLGDDLETQLHALRGAQFEQVVVNELTLPEFEIPVVRVLIPGMQRQGGSTPPERAR